MDKRLQLCAAPLLVAGLLVAGPALAAGSGDAAKTSAIAATADNSGPQGLVNEAVGVVQKMGNDPQLKQLMQQAKGIYIVPDFGRGALGIGARGGSGVMLSHQDDTWTGPAFYNMGGISIGAQAGGSAGQIAFLLMSDNAVNKFKSQNSFSLNAGAGLTIVDYSANKQASWGKGDIILWSDTEGAYAGATVSVTDINWDEDTNRAYYKGQQVSPTDVLKGRVTDAKAEPLKNALPA